MHTNSLDEYKYLLDVMTEVSFRLFKLIPDAGPDLILNLTKEIYIEKYPKYPIMEPEIIDRLEKSNALLCN
jgi:hypothetical protein